ncbi:MAG TPA: peptide ABC transporter substrate-binding protein [Bdellovibrionota bacterium]|nr:peptide ABC transporter substrate-binding protein [Bdellovibrionota bacterium]
MTFSRTLKQTLSTLSLGVLVALGACSKSSKDAATIRMRIPTDPPTIDWSLATDSVSKEVITPLQEGLLNQTTGTDIEPGLAESWTIDPTGKIYEFTLRQGAKWSDGAPVTAQQFVDSWERLLNPATASEYAYFLFDVKGAEDYQSGKTKDFATVGVKAVNERLLRVELKHAASYWIHVPSFWVTFPIRKDLIAKFGDQWTLPGNLVTTGPYMLKEWKRESRILLEKNPNFYGFEQIKNAPAKVEFRTVKEGAIAVTLFKNKEIDILRDPPPIQVPVLSKMPEFVSSTYFRGYYIAFNTKDPRVADVNVRRAIAMSIDRNEIGKILAGVVTPSKTWIPSPMLGNDESLGIDYNPEKAKELWNGLKNKPQNVEIWFDSGERNKIIAENFQSQVKKVLGLDLVIQVQEWKVYLKTLSSATPSLWRLGWAADYPDPDNFMNIFTCSSGNNFTKFCSKDYDKWINEAAGEQNPKKRVELYTKAQKMLIEDEVAFIPLFTELALHMIAPRVKGFHVNPVGDFSFKRITLEP